MAETKIEWAHYTFNPWRGCTKVSDGCKNCYADKMSVRNPKVLGVWGMSGTRPIAVEAYWKQPLKWNAIAKAAGETQRVFCGSLMDIFEGEDSMPSNAWRDVQQARGRLWTLIDETPHLEWLLLTKRPENIGTLSDFTWWDDNFPTNVRLGTSIEDQKTADTRIAKLLETGTKNFLSIEPLLGPIVLGDLSQVDWVIVGGESGPHSRPFDIGWARSIIAQCEDARVPVFVKQLGSQPVEKFYYADCGKTRLNLQGKKGGDPFEWPEDLRVREFPKENNAETV